MPTPTRTTVYFTEPDVARLKMLKTEYSLGASAACRVGLAILVATLKGEDVAQVIDSENVKPKRKERTMAYDDRPSYLWTEDRVEQVNFLNELAANIAMIGEPPAPNLGDGTAEEMVEYALSDEGRDAWGLVIPDWFDDHDRRLLVERVAESL